jgi:hypothetical protein
VAAVDRRAAPDDACWDTGMASAVLAEGSGWHPAATPVWPRLPSDEWAATLATLHRWAQVVGKIRMCHTPWINHSWSVPLYVDARGLGTSLIPHVPNAYEIDFDFVDHTLRIRSSDGRRSHVALESKTTATFYAEVLAALAGLGIEADIHPVPSEIPDAVPFDADTENATYVPAHAHALWQALVQAHRVFLAFRAEFRGKVSPVHFFWGSFDLAVTRFSGRQAPPHPGGMPNFPDEVAREAYSHEVTSLGFWPGNADSPDPIFYAYAYPTPDGFAEASVEPDAATWLPDLGEFVLPYEAVRTSADPDGALLSFAESTHAAAADLADWDHTVLRNETNRLGAWWHTRRGG